MSVNTTVDIFPCWLLKHDWLLSTSTSKTTSLPTVPLSNPDGKWRVFSGSGYIGRKHEHAEYLHSPDTSPNSSQMMHRHVNGARIFKEYRDQRNHPLSSQCGHRHWNAERSQPFVSSLAKVSSVHQKRIQSVSEMAVVDHHCTCQPAFAWMNSAGDQILR